MAGNKDLGIAEKISVEADIDDIPVSINAFVTNLLTDELWLATRLPDPRVARLTQGQGLHLTLERDGPVVFESTFLRRLGDNSRFDMQRSRVFAVRRPLGMENGQRRAHVRIDLERKVGIRSLGAATGQQMGSGKTVNIGAGGVLFTTSMPLLFGEELKLAIALTPRDIVIVGGSIVRIEDEMEPPGSAEARPRPVLARVAVRFDDISEADQEKITLYILKASRQSRRGDEPPAKARVAAPVVAPVVPDQTDPPAEPAAAGAATATTDSTAEAPAPAPDEPANEVPSETATSDAAEARETAA